MDRMLIQMQFWTKTVWLLGWNTDTLNQSICWSHSTRGNHENWWENKKTLITYKHNLIACLISPWGALKKVGWEWNKRRTFSNLKVVLPLFFQGPIGIKSRSSLSSLTRAAKPWTNLVTKVTGLLAEKHFVKRTWGQSHFQVFGKRSSLLTNNLYKVRKTRYMRLSWSNWS